MVSRLNSTRIKRAKATRYSTTAKIKTVVKPNFSIIKPPKAGPAMLAIDGIIMENRLTELALIVDSLSLNWRRLKLGQKVAMPNP